MTPRPPNLWATAWHKCSSNVRAFSSNTHWDAGLKLASFFPLTCDWMIGLNGTSSSRWLPMIFVYSLGVSVCYLSAELSGSIKRMTGGADRVSVAKTPPWSWIPKPVSGSPLRTTSLVSTWKTCPPGPTELDARDTEGRGKGRGHIRERY